MNKFLICAVPLALVAGHAAAASAAGWGGNMARGFGAATPQGRAPLTLGQCRVAAAPISTGLMSTEQVSIGPTATEPM